MALRISIVIFILSFALWLTFSRTRDVFLIVLGFNALAWTLALYIQMVSEEEVSKDWEKDRTSELKKLFDEKKNQEG